MAHGETPPTSFTWRDRRYWASVIGMWRLLCSSWFHQEPPSRTYYRVTIADHLVFELYRTDETGIWMLGVSVMTDHFSSLHSSLTPR